MPHGLEHGLHQLVARERNVHAVDLRRIHQPLHVLDRAKNRRPRRQVVAPDPLKYRRPVVHHMRHHVQRRLVPIDQLPVMPDLLSLLDSHQNSLDVHYIGQGTSDQTSGMARVEKDAEGAPSLNVA